MLSHSFTKIIIVIGILILFINSCDHGLSPPEPEKKITGISGTIYYQNWPPIDSLYDLRLVIFKNFPPPQDLFTEIFSGNATVYPEINKSHLPYHVDSTSFTVELSPLTYEYIAIAQQHDSIFTVQESWRVVGQYDTILTDTIPTAVTVIQDSLLRSIDINVDFDNIPPQPF